MIWDVIARKMVAANLGVIGETIFLDEMPASANYGIMIKSPLAGIRVDQNLPGYYKPDLQLIVRHRDAVEGGVIADRLLQALTVNAPELHIEDSGTRIQINLFVPKTLPIRYPRLTGDLIEWSCNFQTSFTITTQ